MYLSRSTARPARRRGAILLVVLTLIALFSVIGLSFAIYAESEATNSRTRRESVGTNDDAPSQEQMASLALQRMLYPFGDGYTGSALLNATRGTDGATMVYGFHPTIANNVPYNGIGTFHQQLTLPTATGTVVIDRANIINWGVHAPRDAAGNVVAASVHAVDPEHTGFRNNLQIGAVPTGTYVSRAANYTYPDRNNPYVAVHDATTGRIIEPSYVRRSLFNANVPTAPGTPNIDLRLAPPTSVNATAGFNNTIVNAAEDDWLNAVGRYKTIRPRPVDHQFNSNDGRGVVSDWPYIPRNPDGSYTGDVQNLTNAEGTQRNDAVWVNMGLPVMNWRGKNIIPLIAATILPLDARLNVNVAGNTKNAGNNGSTHGFGPWEINLSRILNPNPNIPAPPNDPATLLLNSRTTQATFTPRGATGVTQNNFAPNYNQHYAALDWDANATVAFSLPTGNQSDPAYGTSGYDFAPAGTESTQHPSLLNPYNWTAFTTGNTNAKLFPHTDLRRGSVKYTGKPFDYNAPFFGSPAPTSLTTQQNDTARELRERARRRSLLTTISNSLVRPGVQPNHEDLTTSTLAFAGGSLAYVTPSLIHPVAVGTSSEFGSALNLRAALATLGPVNLNRPLADYRGTGTGPLSITNVTATTVPAAANDRQTMARDVFARLVIATGARAEITAAGTIRLPQPGPTPGRYTLTAPDDTDITQYDALRYLAQIAANVVDYIDNDDINTTFVWNPVVAAPVSLLVPDATSIADTANNFTPTAVMDRVVYGVEKPRVVLNEAYLEVTNGSNDIQTNAMMANEDFMVRFFVELCNPGTAGATGTELTHPLGDGRVTLAAVGGPQAYRCQIFNDWDTDIRRVFNPADPQYSVRNLTGAVGFDPLTGTITPPSSRRFDVALTATTADVVMLPSINNAGTTDQGGFKLLAPQINASTTKTSANEFLPTTGGMTPPFNAAPYTTGLVQIPDGGGQNAFQYTVMRQNQMDIQNMTINQLQNRAVVLRRLANPYIAANDPAESTFNPALTPNPYITVDAFGSVNAQDAIRVATDGARTTNPAPMAPARLSRGRATPYYGYHTSAVDTFAADQIADPMKQGPDGQRTSFFNHNTNFTVNAEWLTHLDRHLINQTELLHVAGVKPHEVLYRFATNPATPQYHGHVAPIISGAAPLYRALELLSVKPFGYGLPAEGRVPGKININMIWDKAVLEALLDQNASSGFTTADVDAAWNVLQGLTNDTSDMTNYKAYSRTKAGQVPGPTFDEIGAETYTITTPAGVYGADRPFKGLGTATFMNPTTPPVAPAFTMLPSGTGSRGLADTILRSGDVAGVPALSGTTATHPYQRAEMLRKMFNNMTTTSDTYLVVMTVGYFEVRNTGAPTPANPVVLGKEVYNEVLGDLRAKFVAVIDRSMIASDNPTAVTGNQVDGLWQTTLAEQPYNTTSTPAVFYARFAAQGGTATNIQIAYEGRVFNVAAGSSFYLGTGANAELVTVATPLDGLKPDGTVALPFDPATGLATVRLMAAPARLHAGGSAVGNALSSNPGPQPNFDVHQPRYKGVVPYFERVEIGK